MIKTRHLSDSGGRIVQTDTKTGKIVYRSLSLPIRVYPEKKN